jgi:hypothetical protein
MTIRILFLLCVFSGLLHGQPSVKNLDLPLFDPSGRLVRRLMAASGSAPRGSLKILVLKSGTVEFFGPDGAEPEKIGTLTFEDATYRKADEVIESDGPMLLRFTNGTLAAVGFRHDLLTGRLLLRSAVVLHSPEAHVTGREGEVFLTQNKADRDMLVSSATIRGEVTITEFSLKEIKADRLETTSATYTGSDSLLRPALPVLGWNKGIKAGEFGGEEFSIPIVRKSKSQLPNPSGGTPEKNSVPPGRE